MCDFLRKTTKGENVKVGVNWLNIFVEDFRIDAYDVDHTIIEPFIPNLCHQCMMFYCEAWTYGYTCLTCIAPNDDKGMTCRDRYGTQCRNKYSEHCLIRQKKLEEVEKLKKKWDFSEYRFTMRLKGRTRHKFIPVFYIPSTKGEYKNWIIDMGCRGHYYYSWISPREQFRDLQKVLPVYPERHDWHYWQCEWLYRYSMDHNNLREIIFDLELAELLGFEIDFEMNCLAYRNLLTPFQVGECPYKCNVKIPLFMKHIKKELVEA
jgi:hypothetical protein